MGVRRYGFISTAAFLAALCMTGCVGADVPSAKSTTGRQPLVAEMPDANETVRGSEEPPIVTLELGVRLHERRLSRNEELPGNIIIPTTNLNAVPVTTALQAVLAGTDVSLSWGAGTFDNRLVTVTNLSGSLPRVVEKICSSARVFCGYRHGLLELKEKETFIVELPAVPTKSSVSASATNSMADAIGDLAGDKARVDQQGGNLIYTADVDGQDRVREYLEQLRNGRPLVVMQLYIWEVKLNRENGTGINWTKFNVDKIGGKLQDALLTSGTAFSSLASAGSTLRANFTGHVDAAAVLQFLSKHGQVQTISSPQMTFVSGMNAEFRVGGKQRYISQVGQLTSGNVSGSNASSSGIGTNTVSTDTIETGLTVNVGGTYESGVISAILELTTQDLVNLNPTTSSGVTIDLPETSERKISSTIRVRPGDNLVMAGLVSSRDVNDRQGIPLPFGGVLPMYGDNQFQNSELVILVKPSVVLFSDARAKEEEKRRADAPIKTPMDAVVIDKDGSQILKMPGSPEEPVASGQPVALAAPSRPELMAPASSVAPLPQVSAPPDAEGAPVDRRLMQRGFSHAFDNLLAPAGGSP